MQKPSLRTMPSGHAASHDSSTRPSFGVGIADGSQAVSGSVQHCTFAAPGQSPAVASSGAAQARTSRHRPGAPSTLHGGDAGTQHCTLGTSSQIAANGVEPSGQAETSSHTPSTSTTAHASRPPVLLSVVAVVPVSLAVESLSLAVAPLSLVLASLLLVPGPLAVALVLETLAVALPSSLAVVVPDDPSISPPLVHAHAPARLTTTTPHRIAIMLPRDHGSTGKPQLVAASPSYAPVHGLSTSNVLVCCPFVVHTHVCSPPDVAGEHVIS